MFANFDTSVIKADVQVGKTRAVVDAPSRTSLALSSRGTSRACEVWESVPIQYCRMGISRT